MKKYLSLTLLFGVLPVPGNAQNSLITRQVTRQKQIWYGYIHTTELPGSYSLTAEIENRSFIAPERQFQFLTRIQLNTKIANGWSGGAGFAYFLTGNGDPSLPVFLAIPELRPHLELSYRQPNAKMAVSHRYRVEQRFFHHASATELLKGYSFNYRFRYRFGVDILLTKKMKVKLNDEILINAGKTIVRNVFDSHRFYAAVNYQPLPFLHVELGYLNLFQQRTSGDAFYARDILRFTLHHRFFHP